MAYKHPFVAVAGHYFCADCHPLSFIRLFIFHYRKLHLDAFGIQRKQIPHLLKAVREFRSQKAVTATETIGLPVFGHLCIPVHHGYKVFDLSRMTVTKYFPDNIDENVIQTEIGRVRETSVLPFAPQLIDIDPGGRWYRESFIPGGRSSKQATSDPVAQFQETVGGYLATIVCVRPGQTTTVGALLRSLGNRLVDNIDTRVEDKALSQLIREFTDRIIARLDSSRELPIRIAFTHGDFSFVNFIHGLNGITVIDWEGADNRSLLHDLYNYFFTERYYDRCHLIDQNTFADAIDHFSRCLAAESMHAIDTQNLKADVYRLLYYLERLQMLTEREASPGQRNVILKTIAIFDQYETGEL